MSDVTQILNAIERGDRQAAGQLLPLIYDELRKLAAQKLAHEPSGQTLQATALVHEAYVRLVSGGDAERWDHRGHFFAAAAEAMRRILVDRVRQKAAEKHGGELRRIEFDAALLMAGEQSGRAVDLLTLDEALTELEQHDEPAARLVKLRYFAGLSHQEAAEAMGVTRRAADRLWVLARAWLFQRLRESE
ncbi:MAG: ECF-type sigma factor [Planctomycetota bacterium]